MSRPTVLVTGGARRIGSATVRAFADAGWHTIIHYGRSQGEAVALAAALPSAECVRCDLADIAAVRRMAGEIAGRHDDWRVLVNNAAIFVPDTVEALSPEVFARSMQVNALAAAALAQAFLASARTPHGRRVIQLTDQKLRNPNPDFFSYTMSKHAVAATIPMLAAGAKDTDRIYGLAPGAILASHDQSEGEADVSHRLNLLRRRTSAREIAEAALFLAEGHLASGQTLFVDSGQHLCSQPRDVIYLARGERAA